MNRRTVLSRLGGAATLGIAGCLGGDGGGGDGNVVLDEPDRQFESADVPYPAWGERVPDVTLPAIPGESPVSVRELDEPALLTYFYSSCQTVCPVLISTLRNVQAHAQTNGYADEVQFLPITFDPERDTAERLQDYADQMNVDLSAGNWQFLRPESPDRARTVVDEQFGVVFQRTHPEDMDMYMFTHGAMTTLVNADGYVERAYRSQSPDQDRIVDDLATVRSA
ncbi:regulatory protein PrrC [Salinarchaeum sp. Harcht-Bsk1]|uniref:SCO family protein n=1 Tax=Salinarchaeum sp. Harcht-Bsk1 TaxID=1333523 RepID=UPI0003423796|nr:SCO family protein [Salinarchaeum sp. Harcht-Bsk1]AGN01640.1 regulatory protein PrrC [Salinarchaeum sp. Harcht-Bsk1]